MAHMGEPLKLPHNASTNYKLETHYDNKLPARHRFAQARRAGDREKMGI